MWAIRLGGEVVWTCNGVEELFDTEEEAVQAMIQESKEIEDDVRLGYLEDFSFEEYRIVEVV